MYRLSYSDDKVSYTAAKGFTLIEILIALVVFSIIAMITSTVLYNTFNTKERVTMHADRLAELQIAIILLQRDFEQSANRPVNISQQELKTNLIGRTDYVEFTTAGYVNPLSHYRRSSLTRVAYLVKDERLIRRTWDSLDAKQNSKTQDKIILSQIESLEFHYLDAELHLAPTTKSLPLAVQINLSLKNWGKMSLLFSIPIGGANVPAPST